MIKKFKIIDMKTSKILFKTLSILLFISSLSMLNTSCSKERIEPEPEQQLNDYQSINNYFDTKKQDEQEFVIDTTGNAPIIGHEGTKIWASKEMFMFANGDSVNWPYTIKLIELYPAKDMIYYQMPTVGNGDLLTSHGEIKITAYKDGEELVLRPNHSIIVEMPNSAPDTNMQIFYGVNNNSIIDWNNSPAGNFTTSSYGYTGNVKTLGWVSCAKNPNFTASYTTYNFTSTTDNLQNVSKFIYLPNSKALMQIYGSTSGNLPIGEDIKIIFIGINNNNELFHFYSETTVSSSSNSVNVEMTQITDSNLTTLLDNL